MLPLFCKNYHLTAESKNCPKLIISESNTRKFILKIKLIPKKAMSLTFQDHHYYCRRMFVH